MWRRSWGARWQWQRIWRALFCSFKLFSVYSVFRSYWKMRIQNQLLTFYCKRLQGIRLKYPTTTIFLKTLWNSFWMSFRDETFTFRLRLKNCWSPISWPHDLFVQVNWNEIGVKIEFFLTFNLLAILSQRGFIILRQMAECHARLCLREFVLR